MPQKPRRVVCLVPYVTEMLVAFGQQDLIVGLSEQDLVLNRGLRTDSVGDYFKPEISKIDLCRPDLVIAAPSHEDVIRHFNPGPCKLLVMEVGKIADAFSQMAEIGRLFDCESQAAAVIARNQDQLALVEARLAGIARKDRKRVVRVMASDSLACPGDDSFQNEMITAAGGIVPHWDKKGSAVPVDPQAWRNFNPQFIYGCHLNQDSVKALLKQATLKDVDAVKNGAVTFFPCHLTCHVSTQVGAFVQWLAAVLYLDTFSDPAEAVLENGVINQASIDLDLPYVEQARVVNHRVADAHYQSVVVEFKKPLDALSTLEGMRTAVRAVGNTHVPMHASLGHMARGVAEAQPAIAGNLGYKADEYAGLMTGARIDNLSVQKRTYQDLAVTVLVTAGVRGNALRMSKDAGTYYKPGTINIIVLTNRRLLPSAMTWAVVTVTEAKTAALLDMDIRSTYTPWDHRATGTGTDTVIVVQGRGPEVAYAGGHTKIGELIAKAVYAGVCEAIFKQNGIKADRDLVQRLDERGMGVARILALYPTKTPSQVLAARLTDLLRTPYYAAFITSALAISDEYRKGLIQDLTFFDDICLSLASKLANQPHPVLPDITHIKDLPVVMAKAFGAMVAGIEE